MIGVLVVWLTLLANTWLVGVLDGDWLVVALLRLVDWTFAENLGVDWLGADLGVNWLERNDESAGDGVDFAWLCADWLVFGVREGDWLRRAANWLPICLADGFGVGIIAFKGF